MFTEFKGIRPLTEGLVDSDYVNCVPTGATLVDRTCYVPKKDFPDIQPGFINDRTKPVRELPTTFSVTGDLFNHLDNYDWNGSVVFKENYTKFQTAFTSNDVLYKIYLSNASAMMDASQSKGSTQHIYVIAEDTKGNIRGASTPIICSGINQNRLLKPKKWSVAVSSTKPNQIYFTFDNKIIYWFNVSDVESDLSLNTYKWEIFCMSGNCVQFNSTIYSDGPGGTNHYIGDASICKYWDCLDKSASYLSPSWKYDITIDDRNRQCNIGWYDNKLFVVDSATGVLNLTCTDPAQFYRNLPNDAYIDTDVEGVTPQVMQYGANNLWTSWYASTLSSDELIDVVAAFGVLFFVNRSSVECWGRTGNESAPLNSLSSYVSNIDVETIKLVGNYLLAIARENGKIGVYTITQQGFNKISNSAVDKYLEGVTDIGIIPQNNESHIAFFKDNEEIVFSPTSGCWYRLKDSKTTQPKFYIDENTMFSKDGNKILTTSRILDYTEFDSSNTKLVERTIVDNLNEFTKRKSFVQLDVLGDMGSCDIEVEADLPISYIHEELQDDVSLSLEYSKTRGKTWSNAFFRKSPPIGKYDAKVTYNGLGSGEAFLMRLKWFTQNNYTIIGIDLKVT